MPTSQIGFPGIGIPTGTAEVTINDQTANYTLTDADFAGGVVVRMNVATPNTVTIPAGLVVKKPVHITQAGAGKTTIVAAGGVTVNAADGLLGCRTRFSNLTLYPLVANSYDLVGDLA